jgi:hypothetical protein
VAYKRHTNLTFAQMSNTASTMYCTLLCLALLPFLTSLSFGKYHCNGLLKCFNILCIFSFFFSILFYILIILCFGIVLCIVPVFVYRCLFPTFVQVYRPLPLGGNPIAVIKYHIVSQSSLIIGVSSPIFR